MKLTEEHTFSSKIDTKQLYQVNNKIIGSIYLKI